jgi:hypothetical protein
MCRTRACDPDNGSRWTFATGAAGLTIPRSWSALRLASGWASCLPPFPEKKLEGLSGTESWTYGIGSAMRLRGPPARVRLAGVVGPPEPMGNERGERFAPVVSHRDRNLRVGSTSGLLSLKQWGNARHYPVSCRYLAAHAQLLAQRKIPVRGINDSASFPEIEWQGLHPRITSPVPEHQ